MAPKNKLVPLPRLEIEPELREFIDELLVPLLLQDALRELARENQLARARANDGKSARTLEPL
jgi:hypothetical protein